MPTYTHGFKDYFVGVGYTKDGSFGHRVSDCFVHGIKVYGDCVKPIKNYDHLLVKRQFDCLVQYGEWNGGQNKLRGNIHDYCKNYHVRKIVLDIGFINHERQTNDFENTYISVGFDTFKKLGKYYVSFDSNRFDQLGVTIKPWNKRPKNKIMIVGQTQGVSTRDINFQEWVKSTIERIKFYYPGQEVVYKPHPNERQIPDLTIQNYLDDVQLVITYNSNYCIESILNGVHTVVTHKAGMAYGYCPSVINSLYNYQDWDRQKFFNQLAYCQWSTQEINSGKCWSRLRNFIYD